MSPTTNPPRPRVVILAAVDATSASDHVVTTAAGLAQTLPGAELHFLHIVDATPRDPSVVDSVFPSPTEVLENGRKLLERISDAAKQLFSGRIVGHMAAGTPWREIVQFATNLDADLVVVGTHDRKGLKRLVLGSVAEQVSRKAPCAVLIARPKENVAEAAPEIEPPCPDCIAVQQRTRGEQLWCERHSARHAHGRLHYESPPSFGLGSMLIRP